MIGVQRGVGLIEVLITLFILAVGLLGVAALQFTGSFANKDAVNRTQAELVAAQVAERLRTAARPPAVGDGLVAHNRYFTADNYNFAELSCTGSSSPYLCYCLERPADIPNCEAGTCNEEEMASYDGWALSCSAVQTNPNIRLNVACDDAIAGDGDTCSAGSRIDIRLSWPINSSANQKYTLNARCNEGSAETVACVYKDITL
ncbi:type IV pilus modification protein PilV [Alteromonas sp. CYL-A6]|uniref:type IV pilus modification protein PilV n=1 Tax=Alteromonas nitratireducens TaxID=3390813 RepID=UPI0034B8FA6D